MRKDCHEPWERRMINSYAKIQTVFVGKKFGLNKTIDMQIYNRRLNQ